ncbi:MAG: hypothetical protein KDK99_20675, partial [Verrucomicrobiales bacterium]|nr:hypothetical protein [Verrucomicrobiales bacterium]
MRPSRLLLKIAIIGTLLALLVTLWPVLTPILMLGTLALVVIAAMDALLLPRRQAFSVSRTLPGRFALGVPAEVQLRLEQHATRPLQVSVADGIPEAAEAAGL